MQKYLSKNTETLKHLIAIINFVILLLISVSILYSSNYIINNNIASVFLKNSQYIVHKPFSVFINVMVSYTLIIILIVYRSYKYKYLTRKNLSTTAFLEVLLSIIIMYNIYFEYNGILILVLIDIIIYSGDFKKEFKSIISLIILLLITNRDFISMTHNIASFRDYISLLDKSTSGIILSSLNFLKGISIALFIIFVISVVTKQTIENERIESELSMISNVNQQLKNYAEVTEKMGEDKERRRIAREIHDTLGHALTGIAAGVDACIAMIDINPEKTKVQLNIISKVVRQGILDVRASLNKLRPSALESDSFEESIYRMVHDFKAVTNIQIDLLTNLKDVILTEDIKEITYRIIQESMTNSVRHGNAQNIVIYLAALKNQLIIDIKDNGDGCTNINNGYGLTHMNERVNQLNGMIYHDGTNGFHTHVEIPLIKELSND